MIPTVESHIPMPVVKLGRPTKYPFGAMEVGDSFFLSGASYDLVAPAARMFGTRHGRKYRVRTVTENGSRGVRVWRVA